EVHSGGLTIVPHGEVAVVRRDNSVRHTYHVSRAPPLADARSARVGEHHRADFSERGHLAIPFDGGTYLLRTGRNHERHRCVNAVIARLLCYVGAPAHVLIR